MGGASGETRRSGSAALSNNRHFADVGAALDLSNDCTTGFATRMIASSTGLADSVVRPTLHRLVGAEVVSKSPDSAAAHRQYYQVLEGNALATIRDLADPDDAPAALQRVPTHHVDPTRRSALTSSLALLTGLRVERRLRGLTIGSRLVLVVQHNRFAARICRLGTT